MANTSKPARGGARKGAGRPAAVIGDRSRASIVITPQDRETLERVGDGVLSRGIQRAAALLRRKP